MINTFREGIIKDAIFIGNLCGYPLMVRPISEARNDAKVIEYKDDRTDLPSYKRDWGSFKMKVVAPPLYIVSWGGQRIDSFLQKKNAIAYAKRLLNA